MPLNSKLKALIIITSLALLAACAHNPNRAEIDENERKQLIDPAQTEYQRALTVLKNGKDQEALKLFSALSDAHPELVMPYINIGLIELQRGNLQAAEDAFLRASSIKPDLAVIHNGLGIIYRQQGRFEAAAEAYKQALHYQHNYANAHLNLGILYEIYLSDLGSALEHYQQYQSLNGEKKELVEKWIIDIKQRLAKNAGSSKS